MNQDFHDHLDVCAAGHAPKCAAIQFDGENHPYLVERLCTCRKRQAETIAPAVPSAPDPQMRALASAMRKLLPPILFAQVLGYLDPLGEFEKFLKSEPASAPDPRGWELIEAALDTLAGYRDEIEASERTALADSCSSAEDALIERGAARKIAEVDAALLTIRRALLLPAAPQVAEPRPVAPVLDCGNQPTDSGFVGKDVANTPTAKEIVEEGDILVLPDGTCLVRDFVVKGMTRLDLEQLVYHRIKRCAEAIDLDVAEPRPVQPELDDIDYPYIELRSAVLGWSGDGVELLSHEDVVKMAADHAKHVANCASVPPLLPDPGQDRL